MAGGRGERQNSKIYLQHIVNEKRQVMQKWRPETCNVQGVFIWNKVYTFVIHLVIF